MCYQEQHNRILQKERMMDEMRMPSKPKEAPLATSGNSHRDYTVFNTEWGQLVDINNTHPVTGEPLDWE